MDETPGIDSTPHPVPPALGTLPEGLLNSAARGAAALDAMAETDHGRNLLAHALRQLHRDGWLQVDAREPRGAIIEIVERNHATTDDTMGGSIIVPNAIRINGMPLLSPADHPVKVHEMGLRGGDVAMVTLSLLARRVTIAAEGDLPAPDGT